MTDAEPLREAIGAHWQRSTGAGDDVLEAHCSTHGLEVSWLVTAARLRQLADADQLAIFGPCQAIVTERLGLYRLAHEPDLARASEAEAMAALKRRRAEPAKLRALLDDTRRRELEP